ncbi:hypothetical protein [Pseudomonas sp. SDO5591_S426]
MGQQSEGKVVVGGIDVQDTCVLLLTPVSLGEKATNEAMAERLSKEARSLWDRAEQLRGIHKISVLLEVDSDDQVSATVRVGGQIHSIYAPKDAEAACQLTYHVIQGFEPPRRLPPFGTRVDQTPPGLERAPDTSHQNQ